MKSIKRMTGGRDHGAVPMGSQAPAETRTSGSTYCGWGGPSMSTSRSTSPAQHDPHQRNAGLKDRRAQSLSSFV
jgi:hypothetical protein